MQHRLFPCVCMAVVLLTLVITWLWEAVNPGLLCDTAQARGAAFRVSKAVSCTDQLMVLFVSAGHMGNAHASEKSVFQVTRAQHVGKSSSFHILLCSFIILVALCWILSSMPMPLMYWQAQNWTQCFSLGLTSVDQRGRITSFNNSPVESCHLCGQKILCGEINPQKIYCMQQPHVSSGELLEKGSPSASVPLSHPSIVVYPLSHLCWAVQGEYGQGAGRKSGIIINLIFSGRSLGPSGQEN